MQQLEYHINTLEEEKEMPQYVEVTHIMMSTPDEDIIEIGKKI